MSRRLFDIKAYIAQEEARFRYERKCKRVRVGFRATGIVLSIFLFLCSMTLLIVFLGGWEREAVPFYGVSCSSPSVSLERETHEISVYGGQRDNFYGTLPVLWESSYELKNISALPVTAELYFPCESQFAELFSPPAAEWKGDSLQGKRYILPVDYSGNDGFVAAKKFSSEEYQPETFRPDMQMRAYEITTVALGGGYSFCARIDGDLDGAFIMCDSGWWNIEEKKNSIKIDTYMRGDEEETFRIYLSGNVRIEFYAESGDNDSRINLKFHVKESELSLREAVKKYVGEIDLAEEEGYTYDELYNLILYKMDFVSKKNLHDVLTLDDLIDRTLHSASDVYAAYEIELGGGEAGTFALAVEWRTGCRENLSGEKNFFYTVDYKAGQGFGNVGAREILLKTEKFVAKSTGAELAETIPPDSSELPDDEDWYFWIREPDWANITIKNRNGWGRYSVTEENATFSLYHESVLGDKNENRIALVCVFLILRLLTGVIVLAFVISARPQAFFRRKQGVKGE